MDVLQSLRPAVRPRGLALDRAGGVAAGGGPAAGGGRGQVKITVHGLYPRRALVEDLPLFAGLSVLVDSDDPLAERPLAFYPWRSSGGRRCRRGSG
jgi:hypothetical protein